MIKDDQPAPATHAYVGPTQLPNEPMVIGKGECSYCGLGLLAPAHQHPLDPTASGERCYHAMATLDVVGIMATDKGIEAATLRCRPCGRHWYIGPPAALESEAQRLREQVVEANFNKVFAQQKWNECTTALKQNMETIHRLEEQVALGQEMADLLADYFGVDPTPEGSDGTTGPGILLARWRALQPKEAAE